MVRDLAKGAAQPVPHDAQINKHTVLTGVSATLPVLFVWYNAWLYNSPEDAWAGLAVKVAQRLEETLTR